MRWSKCRGEMILFVNVLFLVVVVVVGLVVVLVPVVDFGKKRADRNRPRSSTLTFDRPHGLSCCSPPAAAPLTACTAFATASRTLLTDLDRERQ